jgi:glycosyltransferase involved in cell wall biosynthesis
MRILHVVGGLNRGGAETWLVQVLRHIDRTKYQFDFLVHTDQRCAYDDEVKSLGARIMPCLSPSDPIRYARNFLRILREAGPYDCIHSHVHRFSGYILALARLAGVPVRIAHSHLADQEADGRRVYQLASTTLLTMNATAGLGVSEEATKSLFGRNWKRDSRWCVLHLGIDLDPFSRHVDSQSVRAEFGVPEHVVVVGHVGRFVPQKNHTFLLEVAKRVCAANPQTIFVLVGDGPLRRSMEAKAERLGITQHVRFMGIRDDVVRLMKGLMNAFFFPSLYEGFPLVLMEAQAAGLRCLIADTISAETDIFPELITRLSLNADAHLWAESLIKAGSFVETRFQPDAMRDFSIDAAVDRLCGVYERQ